MTDPIDQLRAENERLRLEITELRKRPTPETYTLTLKAIEAQCRATKKVQDEFTALRTKAVEALEKAATLNTGQDCPSENMAVVVAAMNALTALRGDNAGGER